MLQAMGADESPGGNNGNNVDANNVEHLTEQPLAAARATSEVDDTTALARIEVDDIRRASPPHGDHPGIQFDCRSTEVVRATKNIATQQGQDEGRSKTPKST